MIEVIKNINLREFLWKLHKIIHITEHMAYRGNLLVVLILLYVSVSMKCCHENPIVWVLKHHTSISQSSGGWKVQDQEAMSGRSSHPGLWMTVFLLCPHTKREKELYSLYLLKRTQMPSMWAAPSWSHLNLKKHEKWKCQSRSPV